MSTASRCSGPTRCGSSSRLARCPLPDKRHRLNCAPTRRIWSRRAVRCDAPGSLIGTYRGDNCPGDGPDQGGQQRADVHVTTASSRSRPPVLRNHGENVYPATEDHPTWGRRRGPPFLAGENHDPLTNSMVDHLVGQVDAAIGGKTAIDLPTAKNIVGAFHWPVRTVIDPATLETLPEEEARNGRAEVVKTGLLMGEPIWELPLEQQVRRAAAFKTAVCLRDPHDRGEQAQLNLGHTFAHALEAAAGFAPHGRAVALGLLAALRLSGLDTAVVEDTLRPEPVRVDRDAAWRALVRDKKAVGGTPRLVLLDAPGKPRVGVEVPAGRRSCRARRPHCGGGFG